MTRVILISLLAFFISCAEGAAKVQIVTEPDSSAGPLNWQQTITIKCSWEPESRRPGEGEFVINEVSIYSDESPYASMWLEDGTQNLTARVVFEQDASLGTASLVIKDVTAADAGEYQCQVPRKGVSDGLQLDILEPPTAGVTVLTATAEFTEATVTIGAVDGATAYSVGIQAKDAAEWEDVDVDPAVLSHTFTGLVVATDYNVRASASNAAGIRDNIEPAETTFKTKDNRPPKAVDDLTASSEGYNATTITLRWGLSTNIALNHIVTAISATCSKVGSEDDPQKKELAADATTASFEVGGEGDYEFTVVVSNEFSTPEDAKMKTEFTVKKTTTPTPKPPTEKPTTKKPTEKQTTKKTTTEKKTDPKPKVTTPAAEEPKKVVCGGYSSAIEKNEGDEVVLTCTVPDGAGFAADAVKWSYKMGDEAAKEHDDLDNQDDIKIAVADKQTVLTLEKITINQQGTYSCKQAEESSCDYVITVKKTPENGSSLGAAISSILTLIVGLLAFY